MLFLIAVCIQQARSFHLTSTPRAQTDSATASGHKLTNQAKSSEKLPADATIKDINRRNTLFAPALAALATTSLLSPTRPSNAGLFSQAPRRQLELCIVSLLRLQYWAEATAQALQQDTRKSKYLEARLACKALVTGKIGGGASLNVYNLNSLQLKGCLSDLVGYAGDQGGAAAKRKVDEIQTDLLESLASVVEFDGLETTIDPSPRASLTMSMYTDTKAMFVRRTLLERVVPDVQALIKMFPDVKSACEAYVKTTYADELPPRLRAGSE